MSRSGIAMITLKIDSTMKGSITWVIATMTPVRVNSSGIASRVSPTAIIRSVSTPLFCITMNHAVQRTRIEVHIGMKTQASRKVRQPPETEAASIA